MIEEVLVKEFGFHEPQVSPLVGYENANYKVQDGSSSYVFKTYPFQEETHDLLIAESQVLLSLQEGFPARFPRPIPFQGGGFVKKLEIGGEKRLARLLSFLEGDFLGDIQASPSVFQSLGRFLAELDKELQGLKNYSIQARKWEWDIQYLALNRPYISEIEEPEKRRIVEYFFQEFEEKVVPILPKLRQQIIHNDANEWNILVQNGQVSAFIDFGDLAYSPLINELAIAICYATYGLENPLEPALIILKSYHRLLPLEEKEISVLYYLIAARLLISVCNSAQAQKLDPENPYISISEKPAWDMLHKWIRLSPLKAERAFRESLGMPQEVLPSIEEVRARRHQFISPLLSISYQKPILMRQAAFQYMYDHQGNTFLDAYNNIPHVGHSHPRVVEAGQRQMAQLNTNTRYLYEELAEYAEKLLATFPSHLSKVYFVNSGSAASDLALRMARAHTRRKPVMVMEHGYHGNTQSSLDISHYKFNQSRGSGPKAEVITTPLPDTYRGAFKGPQAGLEYAQAAIKSIEQLDNPLAAFISENIVGCGGQVPLAPGYLKALYPFLRQEGTVCISDEVQTGFGRLGKYFWGFEAQEVVPDMVIIGKPMANGHPMGAVLCSDEIAHSFSKGVEFFSSFGGNPVSCVIAKTVLEVLQEEKLAQEAQKVGEYYQFLLKKLQKKYPCIGDVRGAGLFIGVEIVADNPQKPDRDLAQIIKNELRNRHILISTDGPSDNVLKSKPPLCFNQANAREVVEAMEEVLENYFA